MMAELLTSLVCPRCHQALSVDPSNSGFGDRPPTAGSFDKCLRRCVPCGIAYSNGKRPTRIFRQPLDNLPAEVREGAEAAVKGSIHPSATKWTRFGFETSEDALTWVVFRHLQLRGKLRETFTPLLQDALPSADREPLLLLWGSPLDGADSGAVLRKRLEALCDYLGEDIHSRSEPDVIMDFGEQGVVVIEVKFRSDNAKSQRADAIWRDRYWCNDDAFLQPSPAFYQLTRNWRIGWELAKAPRRPFALLNLVRDDLLRREQSALKEFERTLNTSEDRRFLPVSWSQLFARLREEPEWFTQWTLEREAAISR